MGDIDDADAAGAELPQGFKQAFDVVFGQRGRRLVEDENVRTHGQGAADRHQRTLGGGQRGDRPLRVDVGADRRQRDGSGVARPPPGDKAEPEARIAGLNGDVLCDRHPFDEAQILVDE